MKVEISITGMEHVIRSLDRIVELQAKILKRMEMMADELANLTQEVTETEGVVASAVALLTGLSEYIKVHASDPAALTALAARLDTQKAQLAAAVAANPLPEEPA